MRTPPVTLVALLSLVAVTNNACDGSRRASPMPPADSSESGPEVDVTSDASVDANVADTTAADTPVEADRDPCVGVPHEGRCIGDSVERCVTGTGSGGSFISTTDCGAGLTCIVGVYGAACEPSAECRPGAAECRSNTLAVCVAGKWQLEACPNGCNESVAGAGCRPDIRTERYTNTVEFEFRGIGEGFTDWSSEVYSAPARRFLVISYGDSELIDSTITDENGGFEIDAVPAELSDADDFLALIAARAEDDGSLAYAIMDPVLPAGTQDIRAIAESGVPDPQVWYWTWGPGEIASDEGVYLPLAAGSGAAFAFDYLSTIYDYSESFFGRRDGTTVALWLGYGTSWSCGACFLDLPMVADDLDFAAQIFVSADADEAFWSGAVLAHELGHWVMSTYGRSPGEGGMHVMGVPTHPGIAWSEGFATWFSSVVRDETFYYDKQDGLFFWVDFAERAYSSGAYWTRPLAQAGLEQLIDENEVTRMLLGLTDDTTFGAMFTALSSPRMTIPPFLRGYETRTWDGLDEQNRPLPAWSTGTSAPHLADYFDALVCSGAFAASLIDQEAEPWAHYPYPSSAPLCRRSELPIEIIWHTTPTGTLAEVHWYLPLEAPMTLRFAAYEHDAIATWPEPEPPTIVPAGTPPGSLVIAFVPTQPGHGASLSQGPARPAALTVDVPGDHWQVHGRVPYQPRQLTEPTRIGPDLVLRGRTRGASIALTRWSGERAPRRAPAALRLPGIGNGSGTNTP